MKHLPNRQKLFATATVLVLLVPVLALGFFIAGKHQWAQERLAEIEPRHARLLGLEASRAELDQAQAQSRDLLAQYAYPSAQDATQVGNDAQRRLREIFTSAGLEIVSSQVLPPKQEKNLDRVALTLRLEGQLVPLQSALVVLSGQSPALLVDGFSVQTIGAVLADKPQRLAITFNVYVLRVRA